METTSCVNSISFQISEKDSGGYLLKLTFIYSDNTESVPIEQHLKELRFVVIFRERDRAPRYASWDKKREAQKMVNFLSLTAHIYTIVGGGHRYSLVFRTEDGETLRSTSDLPGNLNFWLTFDNKNPPEKNPGGLKKD